MANLYDDIPDRLTGELTEVLLERPGLRLERIVSRGQSTPPGEWYDQDMNEWVLVASGSAALRFEGAEPIVMRAGDHVLIPAHRRHRVEWTDATQPTVWLALHYA